MTRQERSTSARAIPVTRIGPGPSVRSGRDTAATEEPLQVRLGREPFAVIMRTPGEDADLVAGFLLSEGLIRDGGDIASIAEGTSEAGLPLHNVIDVALEGVDVAARLADRRQVAMNASCGMCGRKRIESLQVAAAPIVSALEVSPEVVLRLPGRLRAAQVVFETTGGLHAAALFDADGRLERHAEDVGRHNAVDKVVGACLRDRRLPLSGSVLCVSGRTSFEIVQKACLAGVPIVAAVSAPSTMAIELAEAAGMTLLGFVRGDRFNIYSRPERIRPVAAARAETDAR